MVSYNQREKIRFDIEKFEKTFLQEDFNFDISNLIKLYDSGVRSR